MSVVLMGEGASHARGGDSAGGGIAGAAGLPRELCPKPRVSDTLNKSVRMLIAPTLPDALELLSRLSGIEPPTVEFKGHYLERARRVDRLG